MSAFTILSGLNGALGLYSGVKGLFGAADARDKQRRCSNVQRQWRIAGTGGTISAIS